MQNDPPIPERPLLFLDYDGTLAPIVADPAEAAPHPDVPDLLERLSQRHLVWVVSGRDLAALTRLMPVEVDAIGLHGAEEGRIGGEVRTVGLDEHADAFARMRVAVPDVPGVQIEEKSGAFAVHYRNAGDPEHARRELEKWAADIPEGLEPVWGKKVVELRATGISKGTATARLAREHPDHTPVYLGDDVTDEDAFESLHDAHPEAVTIKVGPGSTAARYRLPDVEAAVDYLARFLP